MKAISQLKTKAASLLLFIIGMLFSAHAWAQDKKVDVDIDVGKKEVVETPWYGAWWMWAIGIALFVIIIVAIVSAGKKK
jgi:hypothetical protein